VRYEVHEGGFTAGLHVVAVLPNITLSFTIADASREPQGAATARAFEVLEAKRAFTVALLIWRALIFVAIAMGE
jgi:hypothetical protein